jgi:hypothetical protein
MTSVKSRCPRGFEACAGQKFFAFIKSAVLDRGKQIEKPASNLTRAQEHEIPISPEILSGEFLMATVLMFNFPLVPLPRTRKPELEIIRDLNNCPTQAICSCCGEEMPVPRSWITSAADNLKWFADQFRHHVEREHTGWKADSWKDRTRSKDRNEKRLTEKMAA